jgi:thiol-disulfide isomerase/thioredoxin
MNKKSMELLKRIGIVFLIFIIICIIAYFARMYMPYNMKENFESNNKPSFALFYADWCPHCKNVKPDWERLMQDKELTSKCSIEMYECSKDEYKELAEKLGIQGYPTFKFFPTGIVNYSNNIDYNGGRTLNDFKAFVVQNI